MQRNEIQIKSFSKFNHEFPDVIYDNDAVCPHMKVIINKGMKFLVPCGKCSICRQKKSDMWTSRLNLEDSVSYRTICGTLTFSDDYLPRDGAHKKDVQLFLKRLRYYLKTNGQASKFRYYLAAEYGAACTNRLHYHFNLFFKPYDSFDLKKIINAIDLAWSCGHIYVAAAKELKGYLTNYICGEQLNHDYVNPETGEVIYRNPTFHLYSKGLGREALKNRSVPILNDGHVCVCNSCYCVIPTYYAKKFNLDKSYSALCRPDIYKKYIIKYINNNYHDLFTDKQKLLNMALEKRVVQHIYKDNKDIVHKFCMLDLDRFDFADAKEYFGDIPYFSALYDFKLSCDRLQMQFLRKNSYNNKEIANYFMHVSCNESFYTFHQDKFMRKMQDKHYNDPVKTIQNLYYQSNPNKHVYSMSDIVLKRKDRRCKL